jgi:galactosylceramidase
MAKDAELNQAVAVPNAHVPEVVNFHTPPEARRLNKPLWDGEAHAHGGDWYAAADYARYNRAYPLGQITKIINWSLITAYPDFLIAPASGPMKANTPWSGHYEVQPPLWMTAHTTQFAEPGWTYLDRSCRLLTAQAESWRPSRQPGQSVKRTSLPGFDRLARPGAIPRPAPFSAPE